MPTFTVYHRVVTLDSTADFEEYIMPTGKAWLENAKQCYQKVAAVNATDLEDVFRITNEGGERHHLFTRSTSVGDVIIDENGDEWMVAGTGFKLLWTNQAEEDMNWEYEREMSTYDPMHECLGQDIVQHIHDVLKKHNYKHPRKFEWLTICEQIAEDYFSAEGLRRIADRLGVK